MDFWPLVFTNLAIIAVVAVIFGALAYFGLRSEGDDNAEAALGGAGAAFVASYITFSISVFGWIVFIVLHFVSKWW
jgi:uncharacterized membrane protein